MAKKELYDILSTSYPPIAYSIVQLLPEKALLPYIVDVQAGRKNVSNETIERIIESLQLDLNAHHAGNGYTALHFAVYSKNIPLIEYLIQKGADPAEKNNQDLSVYDMATTPDIRAILRGGKSSPGQSGRPAGRVFRQFTPPPSPGPSFIDTKGLGAGSFGKVHRIAQNRITKQMELYTSRYPEFMEENFVEVAFLSSSNAPFLPKAISVRIDMPKNKMYLTQNYTGENLQNFTKKINIQQRFGYFELFMFQMARMLVWMEDRCIAHVDIKPANLTVDNTGKLSLIDWGFVTPVYKKGKKYHGTEWLADPSYLSFKKNPTYDYDMLGMGLTLFSFVTGGGYIKLTKDTTESEYYQAINLQRNGPIFLRYISPDLFGLFLKMIEYDENKRISAIELYESPVFSESLRQAYPRIPVVEPEPVSMDLIENNMFYRNALIAASKKIASILHKLSFFEAYGLALSIFARYMQDALEDTPAETLDLYLCASLYIAIKCLRQHLSIDALSKFTKHSVDSIHDTVLHVLDDLDWDVFPTVCLVDYDIQAGNLATWYETVKEPSYILSTEEAKRKRLEDKGVALQKFKSHRTTPRRGTSSARF